jgi:hypothetical protein
LRAWVVTKRQEGDNGADVEVEVSQGDYEPLYIGVEGD